MVLLEFSIAPLGAGESVSAQVAKCVDLIDRSGLPYQLHAMGTIVEGELGPVLQLLEQCVELMAVEAHRISVVAKLDYRQGSLGRLSEKVAAIEKHLGRSLKK